MNILSLFIYAADVVSKLTVLFGLLGTLILILGAIHIIATAIHNDNTSWSGKVIKEYAVWRYVIVAGIFFSFVALIPERSTMYAIAASEVGEKIVTSEPVNGMLTDTLKLVQKKLKDSLDAEKPAEKK